MKWHRMILAGLLALPSLAVAGPFQQKTMQAPFSSREVERGLVLPKGWIQFSFQGEAKLAEGYWGSAGEALDFDYADWFYTTERISYRYGFLPNLEIYGSLAGHWITLTNELHGTDRRGFYLGDPKLGTRFNLLRQETPSFSLAGVIELKSPAGNESPGSFIGGPATFQSFVTTTGGHDLRLGVDAKKELQPSRLAISGGAGWVHRFSGLVQYVTETSQRQFSGRLKAGDRLYAGARAILQAGPTAFYAGPRVERHAAVEMGTTSGGGLTLSPDRNLLPIEGSEGWSADADVGVLLHVTRHVELTGGASIPIRGEDLMFFPLEEIHPTRGVTYSGALQFHY